MRMYFHDSRVGPGWSAYSYDDVYVVIVDSPSHRTVADPWRSSGQIMRTESWIGTLIYEAPTLRDLVSCRTIWDTLQMRSPLASQLTGSLEYLKRIDRMSFLVSKRIWMYPRHALFEEEREACIDPYARSVCHEQSPTGYTCTRNLNHEADHVSADYNGRIQRRWSRVHDETVS